jgi:hypothetical protein
MKKVPSISGYGELCYFFWTLKRHKSIGVFVVYIDTGNSMQINPSKSRDLANENNKILTEWKWFETTVICAVLTFDPQL